MSKQTHETPENIVKRLIESAKEAKEKLSAYKTVGDIQKELKERNDFFGLFHSIETKDGTAEKIDEILAMDTKTPLLSIMFECISECPDECRDIAVDYPLYDVQHDDLDFMVFDFDENDMVSDCESLSEILINPDELTNKIAGYLEELEEEYEGE